jgi:peptide subunit release factor RF-3
MVSGEISRRVSANGSSVAENVDGTPVLLIRRDWELGRFQQDWPKVHFASVRTKLKGPLNTAAHVR